MDNCLGKKFADVLFVLSPGVIYAEHLLRHNFTFLSDLNFVNT